MAAARSNPAARALAGLRSTHSALNDCKEKTAGCERSPGGRTSTFITSLRRKGVLLGAGGVKSLTWQSQWTSYARDLSGECGWVDRYAGFCHPLPLPAKEWRPSIYERRCRRPPAAYPDTRASSPQTCPVWPCSGWGLPSLPGHPGAGGLLHHRFTLTCRMLMRAPLREGGLFSVALACGLPRVGVTHHPALRSPDVPRATSVTRDRLVNPSAVQSTGVEGCLGPR